MSKSVSDIIYIVILTYCVYCTCECDMSTTYKLLTIVNKIAHSPKASGVVECSLREYKNTG